MNLMMPPLIAGCILPIALFIAQMNHSPETLSAYGLAGVVLGWFMFRAEKLSRNQQNVLEANSRQIQSLSRAILIDMLTRNNLSPEAKKICEQELRTVSPSMAGAMADDPDRR